MTDQFKNEWNAGYEKGRDDYCCNHNCNQGRDCPLRKKEMNNEPVAWYNADDSSLSFKNHGSGWQPLYTHSVKEPMMVFDGNRVYQTVKEQLTDEEIGQIWKDCMESPYMQVSNPVGFARAILKKASEK